MHQFYHMIGIDTLLSLINSLLLGKNLALQYCTMYRLNNFAFLPPDGRTCADLVNVDKRIGNRRRTSVQRRGNGLHQLNELMFKHR